MITDYFAKHAFTGPLIDASPRPGVALYIVIPCMAEPDLLSTLESLYLSHQEGDVEILVIINHSEIADDQVRLLNEHTIHALRTWSEEYRREHFHLHVSFHPDLPAKKAGVGLARKIGMDEAARRALAAGRGDAVIACLDADCTVDENYCVAIRQFFDSRTDMEGCAIYFEHPLEGLDDNHRRAIIDYELHLRYFIGMQRWAGHPFAYHTVGSAMAVRVATYCAVGGMNTRQAGEDFYFLHKVIERGAFSELTATTVRPSARESQRVPFGTGRAMQTTLHHRQALTTYNPAIFPGVAELISTVPVFYTAGNPREVIAGFTDGAIRAYLLQADASDRIAEIKKHTATERTFSRRFFLWFNAFRLLKYIHFARDNYFPNIPVADAARRCFAMQGMAGEWVGAEDLLYEFRALDRSSA